MLTYKKHSSVLIQIEEIQNSAVDIIIAPQVLLWFFMLQN